MGLKGYIRERVINAVRFAVREEMKAQESADLGEIEERIVQRLDKQIERWTWERFKRTDKLFDVMNLDLSEEINRNIGRFEKTAQISINSKFEDRIEQVEEKVDEKVKYWTGRRSTELYSKLDKQIERWTWERYKRSEDKLLYVYKLQNQISELLFQQKKVPYINNEKIRIVFLFQVASFWPSWESFYRACLEDERLDVKFVFLDETVREKVQMKTAKEFLEKEEIEYVSFEDFDVDEYNPHILVIQTPYDAGHRIKAHWSSSWKAKGYRVVYVPYGIEISDTVTSRGMHFEQHVIENAWRVYTFNERMKKDYRKYCVNAGAVRTVGLPKFDSLYDKEKFPLDFELKEKIAGRKICLWKVHFPKIFEENGKDIFVTPDINEYIKFAKYAAERKDVFFIFMPHPRFKEPVKNPRLQKLAVELVDTLKAVNNVYIDEKDDYRYSLINADYIIVDRSAVMVEAAATGVPILYMVNEQFYEPVTKGIEPIIESYYKGTTCEDMVQFLNNCLAGIDEKGEERKTAFENCYPYFDGLAGCRIKEDIIDSVIKE